MLRRRGSIAFFLSLSLFIVVLFYVIPLVLTVYVSFTPMKNWNVPRYIGEFISIKNYQRLIHLLKFDPDTRNVVITTIVFVLFTLTINVLGGLALALATYFIDEKLSATYQVLWLLPRMTPVAVYSLLWYYFLHPTTLGILNSILMALHIIKSPIDLGMDPALMPWGAWSVIVFVNGLVGVSYGMIILYSAFKSIPRELIIASRVDGATTWHIIRKILIPLSKWHITFVTVWQLLSLLTSYAHTFLLVEWRIVDSSWGQPWALYVFNTAFVGAKDQGLAAAAAVILSIIGILLGVLALKVLGYERMMTEPKGDI
ncbi:MAG: sugar ABC transporter permease [Thermoplasmata archaeon]|nr:MAG: sugar ABC transporter permease [Thermoplasmata archaeon]